jgi:hypothetical protein
VDRCTCRSRLPAKFCLRAQSAPQTARRTRSGRHITCWPSSGIPTRTRARTRPKQRKCAASLPRIIPLPFSGSSVRVNVVVRWCGHDCARMMSRFSSKLPPHMNCSLTPRDEKRMTPYGRARKRVGVGMGGKIEAAAAGVGRRRRRKRK